MSPLRIALSLALCGSLAHPSVALGAMAAPDACEGATQASELPDVTGLNDDEKLEWAKKLYIEAKGFHESGNYYCSVIKYEQAYTYAPDKHLFAYNLGVDAWELKDCARVKHYMQLFLVNDTESDDLRKDAKRILDEAEASADCITQAGGGASSSGGDPPTDEGSGAPIEDTESAPGLDGGSDGGGDDAKPKKTRKKTSGLLIGGVLLSVLGLGAAGGGVALTLTGKKKFDELTDASDKNNPTGFAQGFYDAELAKSAKTFGVVGPVLLGVGGGLLVGGVVMIVIDRGNKKKGKGVYANRGFQLQGVGAAPLRTGGGAASMTFRF
ncbi:MAG TPA: hypothetical protein ENJ18_08255 [Nannocystis exedens]|nr:hypothetical protein [Nannocystis exedens]